MIGGPGMLPVVPLAGRARRGHPVAFVAVVVLLGALIGGLWYEVFSPLFEDPRDWVRRERTFQKAIRDVLRGGKDDAPAAPSLPAWPGTLDDAALRILACAEGQVARGVRFTGRYHPVDYPWGDVPEHLASAPDLLVRCFRAIGLDLQQFIHVDRSKHPRRYPLHLWNHADPDRSIDHRRLPNVHAFVRRFAEALPVLADTPERRATFLPGDVVFWTAASGGEFPTLAGLVLDRRDASGTPLVATLVPEDGRVTDHHLLTHLPVTGHYRVRPEGVLERFLEENPTARLEPPPAPSASTATDRKEPPRGTSPP